MKLDKVRDKRQREIARKWWVESKGVGAFLAATGFGKTRVALLTIYAMKNKFPDLETLVVVPSDYLRDQWRQALKDANLYTNVRVDTVQTLVNETNKVDLLILDELHSYTSPVFSKVFDLVTYTYILGMTATLREDEDANQILYERTPIFEEVTLEECLKNGWVAPFTIYNYGLTLNSFEQEYYDELSDKFNAAFAFFGHDLNRAFSCLGNTNENKEARRKWSDMTGHTEKVVRIQAVNMIRNMRSRKNFLNSYQRIYDTAVDVINMYAKDRKVITFSQSTDYADKLTNMLSAYGAMSYHSNLDAMVINGKKYSGKSLRNKIIEMYNSNEFRMLNTAKAVDQGVDIFDIDTSLVCSGTSSIVQAIQRTGRNIRAYDDKVAYEINFYIRNTQSEKWLRKRQRKHPKATIKYVSDIQEIVI